MCVRPSANVTVPLPSEVVRAGFSGRVDTGGGLIDITITGLQVTTHHYSTAQHSTAKAHSIQSLQGKPTCREES